MNNQWKTIDYRKAERRNIFLSGYNAVYFYIPKVASTSLKSLFSKLLGYDQEIGFHKTDFPSLLRTELKNNDQYFKFAFVRNPYDRLVSNYFSKVVNKRNYGNREPYANSTFDEFIHIACGLSDEEMNPHFRPQHSFICDDDGQILVDFIGRFENLAADFKKIVYEAGLPPELELPHRGRSERGDFLEYYSAGTRKMVRERFKTDFEIFDYPY